MKKKIDYEKIPKSSDDSLIMPIYSNRLGFSVGEEVYNFSVMSK